MYVALELWHWMHSKLWSAHRTNWTDWTERMRKVNSIENYDCFHRLIVERGTLLFNSGDEVFSFSISEVVKLIGSSISPEDSLPVRYLSCWKYVFLFYWKIFDIYSLHKIYMYVLHLQGRYKTGTNLNAIHSSRYLRIIIHRYRYMRRDIHSETEQSVVWRSVVSKLLFTAACATATDQILYSERI